MYKRQGSYKVRYLQMPQFGNPKPHFDIEGAAKGQGHRDKVGCPDQGAGHIEHRRNHHHQHTDGRGLKGTIGYEGKERMGT